MKKYFVSLGTFLMFGFLLFVTVFFYPQNFGKKPSGEDIERMKKSPNYDSQYDGFVNSNKNVIKEMLSKSSEWDSFIEYYWPTTVGWPDVKILEGDFIKEKFETGDNLFSWLGHSTILMRLNKKNILIDPVFSKFASPLSFIAKRFQAPVVALKDLPKIDYILISHDHYDHLDRESVEFFKTKKDVKFFVPLGVRSHLNFWGIKKNLIIEFDWWGSAKFNDLKFTFTPAQHFSGRTRFIDNATLWGGWVIEGGKRIFFSGDSGYSDHFKKIGEKFPKLDFAFMENGQYDWRWQAVHLMPSETTKAFKEVGAKKLVPIHWGMFNFSLHNWYDPPLDMAPFCRDCSIVSPTIGEIVSFDEEYNYPSKMTEFLLRQKSKHSPALR